METSYLFINLFSEEFLEEPYMHVDGLFLLLENQ